MLDDAIGDFHLPGSPAQRRPRQAGKSRRITAAAGVSILGSAGPIGQGGNRRAPSSHE
jgi:hypothetical protein